MLRYRERPMGGVLSQSVARWLSVTLLVALVACSGGSGGSGRASSSSKGTAPPTTAPSTIDLSKPIPGGSLHGTPRPPLANTGSDYVAIFKSLDGTLRWLTENPDTNVVSDIYVPGSPEHAAGVQNFKYLIDHGWRAADEGYRVLSVEVVDTRTDAVALRVVDQFDVERVVDATGQRVGDGRVHSGPKTWSLLLAPDGPGLWKISDWSPADGGAVQL
ncbi:MAG: hypothetical protein M3046_17015 [Actinomycetota bacterium]|nr:hypothetical protein [Actinomycetota bacterium]